MIKVTQYMRKNRENFFSLERLHEDLRREISSDFKITVWTCKEQSKGFLPRLRDIWRARKQQGDINHVTGDVHYLTYLLDRRRTILTIHDLVLLERKRGFARWLVWLLWYWIPVMRSQFIITISQTTREALLNNVKCSPDKVKVINNPVSNEFQSSPYSFNINCPRILQVGTGQNKNLERVAEALEGICAKLIIIGPISKQQLNVLNHYAISFENYVGLSRVELCDHYKGADMIVFASTYEGFGLPIVEAQATGRPVVTSNIEPMSQVSGSGACLVDPFSVESIRRGIIKVIMDADYRVNLINFGLINAENFRSDVVVRQYEKLYKELINLKGN
jgi:glycosyltransferase involved in cell wall biosynthesis